MTITHDDDVEITGSLDVASNITVSHTGLYLDDGTGNPDVKLYVYNGDLLTLACDTSEGIDNGFLIADGSHNWMFDFVAGKTILPDDLQIANGAQIYTSSGPSITFDQTNGKLVLDNTDIDGTLEVSGAMEIAADITLDDGTSPSPAVWFVNSDNDKGAIYLDRHAPSNYVPKFCLYLDTYGGYSTGLAYPAWEFRNSYSGGTKVAEIDGWGGAYFREQVSIGVTFDDTTSAGSDSGYGARIYRGWQDGSSTVRRILGLYSGYGDDEPTATLKGIELQAEYNPTPNDSVNYLYGIDVDAQVAGGGIVDTDLIGMFVCARVGSDINAGRVKGNLYGLYVKASADGTYGTLDNTMYGARITVDNNPNDDEAVLLWLDEGDNVDWGLWAPGAAPHYLVGKLGLGTTSPSAQVHVVGTGYLSSMLELDRNQNVGSGPELRLRAYRGAAGQDGDLVGQLTYYGYNDVSEATMFAAIYGQILDASDGTEDGALQLRVRQAGTDLCKLKVAATGVTFTHATENLDIVDSGSAGATAQDWIQVKVGGNTGYVRVYSSK
ncbi:MAG: hypothetical protein GWN58_27725 [Anaerolineae bacterium]|nr:hypothetical protein [Anaerolineae bacterium]